ncbi:sensor N-terminal transmembrane domain-containing protein, partial [Bombella apis]
MITGHDELISPLRSTWEYLRAVRLRRWVSPLTSRLLLVNFLPLLFMGGLLLSINEVRNTLLNDSVDSLREQARIYASVLQQAQKVDPESGEVELDTKVAHLFLDDMIRFSRNAQVRLYAPNGSLLTESARGGVLTASGTRWQPNVNVVDRIYGWVLSLIPLRTREGD